MRVSGFARTLRWGYTLRLTGFVRSAGDFGFARTLRWRFALRLTLFVRCIGDFGFARTLRWGFALRLTGFVRNDFWIGAYALRSRPAQRYLGGASLGFPANGEETGGD